MTADLTEIGRDGRGLLWRPHLLTDAMEACGADALAREPVLLKRGDPAITPFKVSSDGEGLSWKWGQWKKLQIAGGRGDARTYLAAQRPSVKWADLPPGDTFELTFYAADDEARGVVMVEMPRTVAFGRDVKFVQRGRDVVVNLLNRVERGERVHVEVLEPGQTLNAALGQGAIRRGVITFRPGETAVRLPLTPFTIIAAVRHLGGRRELLGYVSYNGSDPVVEPNLSLAMDAKLLEKVRGWVGEGKGAPQPQESEYQPTPEEWPDNWPQTSRARLARLAEQAVARLGLSAAEAGRLLCNHPAGLARLVVLAVCGYKHPSAEQGVRGLDEGSFQAALGSLTPHLAAALPSLASPDEKSWAVRHAHSPCLEGAAAWVGGQGVPALRRALHLLEIRADAVAAWERRSRRRAAETASP